VKVLKAAGNDWTLFEAKFKSEYTDRSGNKALDNDIICVIFAADYDRRTMTGPMFALPSSHIGQCPPQISHKQHNIVFNLILKKIHFYFDLLMWLR
jgi:hypothetical protein